MGAAAFFSIALLSVSTVVSAAEIENTEISVEKNVSAFKTGDNVYISQFTYFYKEPKDADYYGNIKAGEQVKIEAVENGYAKITYDGKTGYVNTECLSTSIPYKAYGESEDTTTYIPYTEESIIPANHFFEKLDESANEAIELWLTDEYDDDYIYITDGASAHLNYLTWQRIGWMGLDSFSIIYQKDGINLFKFVVPASEFVNPEDIDYSNLTELNFEFTYTDGVLEIPNEIGTSVKVEFYESAVNEVSSDTTGESEDGYIQFTTTGKSKYIINEKEVRDTSKMPSTESIVENMPNDKADSISKRTFDIGIIIVLITLAVIFIAVMLLAVFESKYGSSINRIKLPENIKETKLKERNEEQD